MRSKRKKSQAPKRPKTRKRLATSASPDPPRADAPPDSLGDSSLTDRERRWLAEAKARRIPKGYRLEVVGPGASILRPDGPTATDRLNELRAQMADRCRRYAFPSPEAYTAWFQELEALARRLFPEIRLCRGCGREITDPAGSPLLTLDEECAADRLAAQLGRPARGSRTSRREYCSEVCRDAYKKRRQRKASPQRQQGAPLHDGALSVEALSDDATRAGIISLLHTVRDERPGVFDLFVEELTDPSD